MVAGRYYGGLVKAANGDIDLVGVRFEKNVSGGIAVKNERTQYFTSRLSGDEGSRSTERCPGDEGAPLRRQSVWRGDVVGLAVAS